MECQLAQLAEALGSQFPLSSRGLIDAQLQHPLCASMQRKVQLFGAATMAQKTIRISDTLWLVTMVPAKTIIYI